MKRIPLVLIVLLAATLVACSPESAAPKPTPSPDRPADTAPAPPSDFELKPETDPAALTRSETVDLNLGSNPEQFVRCLWRQLTGAEPDAEWTLAQAALLGTPEFPRRIDLALALAEEAGRTGAEWAYSDPWAAQVPLSGGPDKRLDRDVGAVFMFFFTSPQKPNGGTGWANNHAPGMLFPDPSLDLAEQDPTRYDGLFHPRNAAFWHRELTDARYAGLDFILPNVYGPDLKPENLEPLRIALDKIRSEHGEDRVKLGMFDDTWTWGQPYFGPFWEQQPDCAQPEITAKVLYDAKWKPFFEAVPREDWYLVDGRPLIYFYNNNSLQNRQDFDRVLLRMKARFKEDFGVEPFVAVDTAFNYRPSMKEVSDSHFKWYTFDLPEHFASETRNGITLSHSMVRWDSTSRWNDHVEARAKPDDLIVKDDRVLRQVLDDTRDSDILVIATWNDLGEGTGINRCYDYYWDGEWKRPDHFMRLIRRSQEGELVNVEENGPKG